MDAGPLNLVRPEVPVELAALVAKMMAKEPDRRFQTPGEVAQALAPFFKKGSVAVKGANPEISQVGQPEATQPAPRPVPVPARPAMERTPAPVSEARKPAPTQPGSILEGLIDLRETEPLFDTVLDTPLPVAAPQASRRNLPPWSTAVEKLSGLGPRAWWAAAGVLLLGFVVAWAVVLRVKTSNGIIELVNLPQDAEVFVDGEKVTVTWPGGGRPAVVTVTAGKHKIKVKKDELETSGEEVTVQTGGKEELTVRFVPLVVERPKKEKADVVQPSPAKRLARFPAEVSWGRWTISSNEVVVSWNDGHSRVILAPNEKYESVTLEAEVKRKEGNGRIEIGLEGDDDVSIAFGTTIENSFTKAHLIFWDWRSRSYPPAPDPHWVGAVDNDKWDSLRMAKKDGVIKGYFNKKEIISAKVKGVRFRLILFTADASARFRNIKVRDASGRVLLEGLPDLPVVEE